jgi:hypothetical protein
MELHYRMFNFLDLFVVVHEAQVTFHISADSEQVCDFCNIQRFCGMLEWNRPEWSKPEAIEENGGLY